MRSLTSSDSDEHVPETQTYFRGVYPCGKRWKAQIHFEGAQHYLGTYETPEEAAKAYDQAAREHHGERGKTNYDKNGELSESIKRRRARPRPHHKRGSVTSKPAAISPTGPTASAYPLSILGKRSLDYTALPRPELHALSSYSSVYTHENDGNTIESLSGSTSRTHSPDAEHLHAQIAMLSECRSQVEYLLYQHPMAAAAAGLSQEDLHDEYVVCTIRLDDLMRRVRRKEPHQHSAAAGTAAAAASAAQPGPATATPSPRNSPGSAPGRPGSAVSDKWHSPPGYAAGAMPPAMAYSMRSSLPLSTASAARWT